MRDGRGGHGGAQRYQAGRCAAAEWLAVAPQRVSKLVFKAQAKRERGPIGDAERRKQLGLLRDESWAVRIKKGRTATRTVATGLG